MTPEPLKLQDRIQQIEIEINNLKNEKTDLIMENISYSKKP